MLKLENYLTQNSVWPQKGRHIMAQYNGQSIVVYQAYSPAIGNFAAKHKFFGGDFSFDRMSWIKPNFLWMMYRSGWGTKEGQEVVLAIWLKREGFDTILKEAVHSSYTSQVYASQAEWKKALKTSQVRLQWDPDHDPSGVKLERNAIQLGLQDKILTHYAKEWIIDIEDISSLVLKQRQNALSSPYINLLIPQERIYTLEDSVIARNIRLSGYP